MRILCLAPAPILYTTKLRMPGQRMRPAPGHTSPSRARLSLTVGFNLLWLNLMNIIYHDVSECLSTILLFSLHEGVQFPVHSHSDTGSAGVYFVTPSTAPSASATICMLLAKINSCYTGNSSLAQKQQYLRALGSITKVMEEKYTKLNKSRTYMNTIHAHHSGVGITGATGAGAPPIFSRQLLTIPRFSDPTKLYSPRYAQ